MYYILNSIYCSLPAQFLTFVYIDANWIESEAREVETFREIIFKSEIFEIL